MFFSCKTLKTAHNIITRAIAKSRHKDVFFSSFYLSFLFCNLRHYLLLTFLLYPLVQSSSNKMLLLNMLYCWFIYTIKNYVMKYFLGITWRFTKYFSDPKQSTLSYPFFILFPCNTVLFLINHLLSCMFHLFSSLLILPQAKSFHFYNFSWLFIVIMIATLGAFIFWCVKWEFNDYEYWST